MNSYSSILASLALTLFLGGCGDSAPTVADPASNADDLARARAAAAFTPGSAQDLAEAWRAIAPLIEREQPRGDDLLRAGIIAFHLQDDEALAQSLIERAGQALPDDPAVHFMRGCLLLRSVVDPERAAAEFAAVLAVDPDDAPSRLQLATALRYSDDFEGATRELEAVRALGRGRNAGFYAQATYRLGRLRIRMARGDAAGQADGMALLAEHTALKDAGIEAATETAIWTSSYGRVRPPEPPAIVASPSAADAFPAFSEWSTLSAPAEGLLAADLDGDGRSELIGWGRSGVTLWSQQPDGSFVAHALHDRAVSQARLGDLDDADPDSPLYHPAPELLCLEDGHPRLYGYDKARQTLLPMEQVTLDAVGARAATFVDLDHQGSLDLVLSTDDGLRLLRNDGASDRRQRQLVATTPQAFDAVAPSGALLIEDLDGNQAIDLLAVGAGGVTAVAGLWDDHFADRSTAWGLDGVVPDPERPDGGLTLVDIDNDGHADLIAATAEGLTLWRHDGTHFTAPRRLPLAGAAPRGLVPCDLDRDGHLDLLGRERGSGDIVVVAGPLTAGPLTALPLLTDVGDDPGDVLVADLDGDGALDLALAGLRPRLWHGAAPAGNGLTLRLAGRKANTHGVGAVVEIRAGPLYRRILCHGEPLLLGLGPAESLDVATVLWPDGVRQPLFGLAAGETHTVVQIEGLAGSCPFLYSWNGETYQFISDVLGTAPLGLPMAPGVHVPFDHDEYVRISGEQLVPRNGRLQLVLTEELREVTYLDRARLQAIDHPREVEIQPNEAFVFPPFPPHHVYTFRDVVAPARVIASNGEDVTELLARVDGRHAQPFVHRPAQFRGLTEPWYLEIQLAESADERAALAAAPRLRLALTGWLLWGDASVNVSAARHPSIAVEPPRLWLPEGDGWRPAGPPIGFIAGKTKTMVVDITDIVDRDDPRLRLSTTLALSYDAIRLVLDDDDAPYRDTALDPLTAKVAWRGFSALLPDPSGEFGELFDWDQLAPARWDQHPGLYTRYGDVLELLGAVDDRTVIFGAGDAVSLAFDASGLPELPPGWSRDWLLYLDGWAKDRDPNTNGARTVEPLPFHGMSDYPPPPGETFPDTPEHTAWRLRYNTRPGRRLLPRLSEPLAARPDGPPTIDAPAGD